MTTPESRSFAELLRGWLPGQRWFPAAGEFTLTRVGGVRLDGQTASASRALEDAPGRVRCQLHLVAVEHAEGTEVISVPVTVRPAPLAGAEDALIGVLGPGAPTAQTDGTGTGEGTGWVYDGAHDPAFLAGWLETMRRELPTADGRSAGHAYAGFEHWPAFTAESLRANVLTGEQSNTSVIVHAERGPLILKFFRVIAAGTNPDVEIGLALSAGGSTEVPVTFGSATAGWQLPEARGFDHGEVAVLREFITGSQDAWRVALRAATAGEDFTAQAAGIGAATGRLHRSLADAFGTRPAMTDRPHQATAGHDSGPRGAAGPEPSMPRVLAELAERVEWGWRQASAAVGTDMENELRRVLQSLREPATAAALPHVQRIHADYHLGQVLASDDGAGGTRWTVLDFEGEPLREASERSGLDLPLRDVVGMLRSFDYAGALAAREADGSEQRETAHAWTVEAQQAFLTGYSRATGVPVDPQSPVFTALLLDKALYEVAYERRHRPDWVGVPVAAVRRVLDRVEAATVGETPSPQRPAGTAPTGTEPTETAWAETAPTITSQEDFMDKTTAGRREPLPVDAAVLDAVGQGRYHQPHEVLGAHLDEQGTVTFRILRPLATSVAVRLDDGTDGTQVPLEHEHEGIWVGTSVVGDDGHVPDYRILVAYGGEEPAVQDDPYRYLPTVGELDQHLIREGRHETLWTVLGSRVRRYASPQAEVVGASFAVWAPNAQAVRVKGDFNGWNGRLHAMRSMGQSGIWEIFIPGIEAGAVYKYEILAQDGIWRDKADPMARWTEVPPATGSRVEESRYVFEDDEWMQARAASDPHSGPMSVYEVHPGSWRPGSDYRELADSLVEYVSWQGFSHVEFMPVAEHPFGGSWGYQVTGYYAPTSRFGTPDDFKYLVDRLHQAGIGVLLDWVPAHFPMDEFALAKFDGGPLYEYADPRKGEHPDWGTLVFDFGRTEVRNFLVANALYWLEEYHVDGLRVDAVASMLYLDYSREDGQWVPNQYGGNENLEAISFLQEATATAYRRNPGTVMIAEESTAFPGVTAPTDGGGLGFGEKWNMGWMHDSLNYMSEDPVNRTWHHGQMTFSLVYAWSENYVLPLSHDEVVHGKGSLIRKMPGDRWQQLANLRAYYGFMWAHPGKQLLFMGSEFGQESEWNEAHGLDWWLTETPQHKGLMLAVRDLNRAYRESAELWSQDNDPAGFQWIDQHDADRNLFSFIRWSTDGQPLVCISNFSGALHHDVRLGLPRTGAWQEVVNTDAELYGGSGVSTGGTRGRSDEGVGGAADGATIHADDEPWHGQPASAMIAVPPLATVWFRPVH